MGAPGPTRRRRTRRQIEELQAALYLTAEEEHPVTVRGLFYRVAAVGLVDKTEAGYKVVKRVTAEMLLAGLLPFSWITDGMRKPATYADLGDALAEVQDSYRRMLWASQPVDVEVWCEKDAMAGVLYPVTERWDVPLMITRGDVSLSFLWAAAATIAQADKPAWLYYLGDHDGKGLDIPRIVAGRLREFAPRADIHFERLAVNAEQIEEWDLPTRPRKTASDPADCVELDAVPTPRLRALLEETITGHVDAAALAQLRAIEESERESLAEIVRRWRA